MSRPVLCHIAQVEEQRLVQAGEGLLHQQLAASLQGWRPPQWHLAAEVQPQLKALPPAGAVVRVVAELELQLSHRQALTLLQHREVKVQTLLQTQQRMGLCAVNEVA